MQVELFLHYLFSYLLISRIEWKTSRVSYFKQQFLTGCELTWIAKSPWKAHLMVLGKEILNEILRKKKKEKRRGGGSAFSKFSSIRLLEAFWVDIACCMDMLFLYSPPSKHYRTVCINWLGFTCLNISV